MNDMLSLRSTRNVQVARIVAGLYVVLAVVQGGATAYRTWFSDRVDLLLPVEEF
ncbi:MAG: hypothetical protein L0H93_02715 [Nocardioides sp.]|nr:hypothetical protein [Nocardioides sp.]